MDETIANLARRQRIRAHEYLSARSAEEYASDRQAHFSGALHDTLHDAADNAADEQQTQEETFDALTAEYANLMQRNDRPPSVPQQPREQQQHELGSAVDESLEFQPLNKSARRTCAGKIIERSRRRDGPSVPKTNVDQLDSPTTATSAPSGEDSNAVENSEDSVLLLESGDSQGSLSSLGSHDAASLSSPLAAPSAPPLAQPSAPPPLAQPSAPPPLAQPPTPPLAQPLPPTPANQSALEDKGKPPSRVITGGGGGGGGGDGGGGGGTGGGKNDEESHCNKVAASNGAKLNNSAPLSALFAAERSILNQYVRKAEKEAFVYYGAAKRNRRVYNSLNFWLMFILYLTGGGSVLYDAFMLDATDTKALVQRILLDVLTLSAAIIKTAQHVYRFDEKQLNYEAVGDAYTNFAREWRLKLVQGVDDRRDHILAALVSAESNLTEIERLVISPLHENTGRSRDLVLH